jgi:5-methylcytosine-specific restriction endonuclease McrA
MSDIANDICSKALKLDSSYRPVEVIDSLEALVLCICGKAIAVEVYETTIRSVSDIFQLPAVIALNSYVKHIVNEIAPRKKNIIWRDRNQCQYCGRNFNSRDLTIDHIIPRSRGGENTWLNLTACCHACNQKKGPRTPEEAGMKLLNQPYKPKSFVLKNVDRREINDLWSNYLWHI